MAGHSHAANIARRKGAVDAKRAKVFSKCAKAVMSAVRQGGPDPSANLKLRYAIEKARAANMPKENIERAIKRGSGEGAGDIEELTYEGYAPGGVAVMVTCLTDNRNRTAAGRSSTSSRSAAATWGPRARSASSSTSARSS